MLRIIQRGGKQTLQQCNSQCGHFYSQNRLQPRIYPTWLQVRKRHSEAKRQSARRAGTTSGDGSLCQKARISSDLAEQKLSRYREPKISTGLGWRTKAWTAAEWELFEQLLRQDRQIWTIAARLNRSELAITRRLRRNEKLRALWKPVKKGRFSTYETEYLIRLRRLGFQVPVIALYLGREEDAVRRKINKEARHIFRSDRPSSMQGPQTLTPELEDSIVRGRLQDAFRDLLRCDMSDSWRRLLSHGQTQSWISTIAGNIPAQVKRLLASQETPVLEKLEELPWIETNGIGVYGWIMKPTDPQHFNRECYFYVGSATKYGFGLNGRRSQHLSRYVWEHNSRLLHLIRRNGLRREGKFITLMAMDTKNLGKDDLVATRHTVMLAEAIFTEILGALQGPKRAAHLHGLYPWTTDGISWKGCCSHNPITLDISPSETVYTPSRSEVAEVPAAPTSPDCRSTSVSWKGDAIPAQVAG